MAQPPLILIVDDEQDIARIVEFALKDAGFETQVAGDAVQALARLQQRIPDLVILDLMLPDLPGTEICKQIKASPRTRHVPVLMLTAKNEELDRVLGFELGADDFVVKPFSPRELVLRVRAVLRRGTSPEESEPVDEVGPIKLDSQAHRCFIDGSETELTALEFKLLSTFMSRIGRVQTRERLLQDVWGVSSDLQTRTVDTHVKRLREKLGSGRDLIETVRGIGYRMADPRDA